MNGSPYYIAPEVFQQSYKLSVDIWSIGVVLYILLSGKVPFPGRTETEIIYNVLRGEYHFNHAAFNDVSDDCKDLIRKCLVRDPESRISASNSLQHQWIV